MAMQLGRAVYENREVTHKTRFKVLERAPVDQRYIVGRRITPDREKIKAGLGAGDRTQGGLGSIIDLINQSKDNPVYSMDVIEQVRWTMNGPQTPASIRANFGAEIDLFGSGKSVQGIDSVETTMAQTGETQTYFIACYLGYHVETEPMQWTETGNAWTHPTVGTNVIPQSPDFWTEEDFLGGLILNAGQMAAGQVFLPALLEWGWWANLAAWHMVRGYNLRWKIGQHTNIMDEVLRHTAYMPPNAQEGSASNSQVDAIDSIFTMNTRYDSLGSALNFLKVDSLRIGSDGAGGLGIFHPNRDLDRVDATYGGMDLRSMLRGNSEFRKLTLPYVIKPGVPIGIVLQENDTNQADQMRRAMDITLGQSGAIPPFETDDPNILAGFDQGVGIRERTVDGFDVFQHVRKERVLFKGGDFKLSLMVRGFEVTEDWYNIMSANADIRDVVMTACGIKFAMQGAA